MALHWLIDSRARLIVVTAEGSVSRTEIDGLLDAVTGAKALGCRKLVKSVASAKHWLDCLAVPAA
jgi:hypothetical protein